MKRDFNVDVKGINMIKLNERKNVISETRSKIIDNYEDGTKNISEVINLLELLSKNMDIKKEKLFSQCWKTLKVNKNEFIYRITEEFLNESVETKYICILVVYILQNLCNENGYQCMDNSFIDISNIDMLNEYSSKLLHLASQLLSKTICNVDSEQLQECLAILPWVDSIYFFDRYNKKDKSVDSLKDNQDIHNFKTSSASLLGIQKVFILYTTFIGKMHVDLFNNPSNI